MVWKDALALRGGALSFYWIISGLKKGRLLLFVAPGLLGGCDRGCSLFQRYLPPVAVGSC